MVTSRNVFMVSTIAVMAALAACSSSEAPAEPGPSQGLEGSGGGGGDEGSGGNGGGNGGGNRGGSGGNTQPNGGSGTPGGGGGPAPTSSGNPGGPAPSGGGMAGLGGSAAQCQGDTPLAKISADPNRKACLECVKSKCSAEYQKAFGAQPETFGGTCGDLINCTCKCASNDFACSMACAGKVQGACATDTQAYTGCQSGKCGTECK
jgi:hypothetical protein